ncbi:MAG TPA: hypothetical protein VL588_11935 [Bdellovibrionota bacterium]|nr:hypothetical protein [Bdellovibrionota bacterium]
MTKLLSRMLPYLFMVSLVAAAEARAQGSYGAPSDTNSNPSPSDTSQTRDIDKVHGLGMDPGAADSIKDVPHITLDFRKGSSVLSSDDESKLRELVNKAQTGAKIDQMTVAAWSDKALPKEGQKLSDADQRLAKGRSDAVYMFLKDQLNVPYVATYNMAEDANWLAKTFRTSDAELKSLFGKKGTQTPVTNNEMKIIKDEGGPSKVVVLVERNP